MKKKTYFENLNSAIIQNNKKALAYGDGKAWDNKKRKTMKSHMPRGNAFRRLDRMMWQQLGRKITDDLNAAIYKLRSLNELQHEAT